MGLKIIQVSKGCKNILGVKFSLKYFTSQLGVKKFQLPMGEKVFQVSNKRKNILGVKWV